MKKRRFHRTPARLEEMQPVRSTRPRVVILLDPVHSWHQSMLHGIANYLHTHTRWNILLPSLGDISPNARMLSSLRIQGLIIGDYLDRSETVWSELRRMLRHWDVPVVLALTVSSNSGFCEVVPDDAAVGRVVAKHLRAQGYHNFGYYGGDMPYSQIRLGGFRKALAEEGRDCCVFMREEIPWGKLFRDWETRPLAEWLRNLARPAAVMACSDLWARHVNYTCQRIGLRIPEDIALVGVDNHRAVCEIVDPPLTSVPLDLQRIGFVAAGLLDEAMQGKKLIPQVVTVPPLPLVVRHSSNLLIVDDADIARAAQFIRANAATDITVEDVLRAVGISRRKLETGFQQAFGRTPQKEIWRVHVERAKTLLEQTREKMPRIAQQSGFAGADRLSLIFRRETGISPRDWRKRAKGR